MLLTSSSSRDLSMSSMVPGELTGSSGSQMYHNCAIAQAEHDYHDTSWPNYPASALIYVSYMRPASSRRLATSQRQVKRFPSLTITSVWMLAPTPLGDPVVSHLMGVTLAKHSCVLLTFVSVGSRVEPQVSTSAGVLAVAAAIRVSTNFTAEVSVQAPSAAGRLTWSATA